MTKSDNKKPDFDAIFLDMEIEALIMERDATKQKLRSLAKQLHVLRMKRRRMKTKQ